MKREIIAELKRELQFMETASRKHEFEKHLYAMERLLNILKDGGGGVDRDASPVDRSFEPAMSEADRRMLEQMGGSVPHSAGQESEGKQLKTEDGSGNGESLFDF